MTHKYIVYDVLHNTCTVVSLGYESGGQGSAFHSTVQWGTNSGAHAHAHRALCGGLAGGTTLIIVLTYHLKPYNHKPLNQTPKPPQTPKPNP